MAAPGRRSGFRGCGLGGEGGQVAILVRIWIHLWVKRADGLFKTGPHQQPRPADRTDQLAAQPLGRIGQQRTGCPCLLSFWACDAGLFNLGQTAGLVANADTPGRLWGRHPGRACLVDADLGRQAGLAVSALRQQRVGPRLGGESERLRVSEGRGGWAGRSGERMIQSSWRRPRLRSHAGGRRHVARGLRHNPGAAQQRHQGLVQAAFQPSVISSAEQPWRDAAAKHLQRSQPPPMDPRLQQSGCGSGIATANQLDQQRLQLIRAKPGGGADDGEGGSHGMARQVSLRSSSGRIARNSPVARTARMARQETAVRDP